MAVYSVLEPPDRDGGRDGAERFVFVREGFSWAAFFFGALWMLWRRLWLVLLGYLVLMAGFEVVFQLLGASVGTRILTGFLIALLIGLEAGTLRRWTLIRRGGRDHGIVVGDDLEAAERRFFSARAATSTDARAGMGATPAAANPAQRTAPGPLAAVLGLFPRPGGGR